MSKICMFGISGSGKTCYLYAMAQVMNNGVSCADTHISIIANDIKTQQTLFAGYLSMAADKKWPASSSGQKDYDFCVRVNHKTRFAKLIPSLIMHDYAGGIWTDLSQSGEENRDALLNDFKQSSAILFIVDSDTLLKAMSSNSMDIDASHRLKYENTPVADILRAKQQVSLAENLLYEYKKKNTLVPPILLIITKGDIFVSDVEQRNAYAYLRRTLPSIFANGSQVESAITTVALGDNLENAGDNRLSGTLDISIGHNIHIPMLFALYAYLDDMYDGCSPDEQNLIDDILPVMRRLFADKISFYKNGDPAFAV